MPQVWLPRFNHYGEGRLIAAGDGSSYLVFRPADDRYLYDVLRLQVTEDLSWSEVRLKRIEAIGFGNLQASLSPSGRYAAIGFDDDYVEVIRLSGAPKQIFRKRMNGDAELLFIADEKSLIVLDNLRMTRLAIED